MLFGIIFSFQPVEAQLREKAKELLTGNKVEQKADTLRRDTASLSVSERMRLDSIRLEELSLQLQQMKLNEIVLVGKLDNANSSFKNDSLRRAAQRKRIDSLRALTPGGTSCCKVRYIILYLFATWRHHSAYTCRKRTEYYKGYRAGL